MKILFPHIPPSTTPEVLCDLVTRFTPRKSRRTDTQETPVPAARVIRIQDAEGRAEYFGLVEPVSEDDGRCFLAIAGELSRRSEFVVAREFKARGPKNPFFSPEDDRRRPDLKLEVLTDPAPERVTVQ